MNLNTQFTAELTEFGAKAYNAHYAWLRRDYPDTAPDPKKEGDIITEELWHLMAIFGVYMANGMPQVPFKGNEIKQVSDIAAAPEQQDADPVVWIRKTDITELTDSEPETNGWTPLYAHLDSVSAPGSATAGAAVPRYETVLLAGDHGHINSATIQAAMIAEINAYRKIYTQPTAPAEVSPPDGAMPEQKHIDRDHDEATAELCRKFIEMVDRAHGMWPEDEQMEKALFDALAERQRAAQPAEGSAQVAMPEIELCHAAGCGLPLKADQTYVFKVRNGCEHCEELRRRHGSGRIAAPERSDTPAAEAAGRAYREQQLNSDVAWESLSSADRAGWINDAKIAASQALDANLLPLMRTAFRIEVLEGEPRRYSMQFVFKSLDELHNASDEWRSFVQSK